MNLYVLLLLILLLILFRAPSWCGDYDLYVYIAYIICVLISGCCEPTATGARVVNERVMDRIVLDSICIILCTQYVIHTICNVYCFMPAPMRIVCAA